jgi:hypothetical protein
MLSVETTIQNVNASRSVGKAYITFKVKNNYKSSKGVDFIFIVDGFYHPFRSSGYKTMVVNFAKKYLDSGHHLSVIYRDQTTNPIEKIPLSLIDSALIEKIQALDFLPIKQDDTIDEGFTVSRSYSRIVIQKDVFTNIFLIPDRYTSSRNDHDFPYNVSLHTLNISTLDYAKMHILTSVTPGGRMFYAYDAEKIGEWLLCVDFVHTNNIKIVFDLKDGFKLADLPGTVSASSHVAIGKKCHLIKFGNLSYGEEKTIVIQISYRSNAGFTVGYYGIL